MKGRRGCCLMPHYALKARVYKCAGPIACGALLWLASIAASRGRRRDMADVHALVVELGHGAGRCCAPCTRQGI